MKLSEAKREARAKIENGTLARMRLVVDITFDRKDVPASVLMRRLHELCERAAGERLFTGDTTAEVVSWTSAVRYPL